jgi:hypothetical protein
MSLNMQEHLIPDIYKSASNGTGSTSTDITIQPRQHIHNIQFILLPLHTAITTCLSHHHYYQHSIIEQLLHTTMFASSPDFTNFRTDDQPRDGGARNPRTESPSPMLLSMAPDEPQPRCGG